MPRPAFDFTKNEVWIGRESDCDIIFDASSGTVSRKHASIRIADGEYVLTDNNSFNGTLLNENRITAPVPLSHGDSIRFGMGGPVLRFNSPAASPKEQTAPNAQNISAQHKTIVLKLDNTGDRKRAVENVPQLLMSVQFAGKTSLTVGRTKRVISGSTACKYRSITPD